MAATTATLAPVTGASRAAGRRARRGAPLRRRAPAAAAAAAEPPAPAPAAEAGAAAEEELPQDWLDAKKLLDDGEAVEAKVVGSNAGGVLVRLGNLRGFVPASQLAPHRKASDMALADALELVVDQTLKLRVMTCQYGPTRRSQRLVLSETEALKADRIASMRAGDVVSGKVTKVEHFGAFVALDGKPSLSALCHASELSWEALRHPSDAVRQGDKLQFKVLSAEPRRNRVNVSLKAMQADPLLERMGDVLTETADDDAECAIVPGVEAVCERLRAVEGVVGVTMGRCGLERRVVSQDFELWMAKEPAERGFNLLARNGREVQELCVETDLDKEDMRRAVQDATAAVRADLD